MFLWCTNIYVNSQLTWLNLNSQLWIFCAGWQVKFQLSHFTLAECSCTYGCQLPRSSSVKQIPIAPSDLGEKGSHWLTVPKHPPAVVDLVTCHFRLPSFLCSLLSCPGPLIQGMRLGHMICIARLRCCQIVWWHQPVGSNTRKSESQEEGSWEHSCPLSFLGYCLHSALSPSSLPGGCGPQYSCPAHWTLWHRAVLWSHCGWCLGT